MSLVEPTLPRRRFPRALLLLALFPAIAAVADAPIASSSFVGFEDPLFENGAWAPLTSMSPDGVRFQKNNGAMVDVFNGAHNNHAGARTTAAVPTDHYSEIVVGHVGNRFAYVGPFVRLQPSGPSVDSGYLWWGSLAGGDNNFLYRIDANGTSYGPTILEAHSPIADGDRLRLIARGPVIYGIKNGVREFIHNTGQDRDFNNSLVRYATGTAGMLAYVPGPPVTDATIASWSTGPAPTSSGVWASSNFAGVEDPLDEGDRWYPLPGYHGFKKAGGFAVGKDGGHNFSGVWSISPPPTQYSEVTLGAVGSGGGGPLVRIDRNNPGQTGWLLFLWVANPTQSGIFKVNPDGSFTLVRPFTPSAIVTGDKWRLTATGNVLEVFQNGVSQFTFTTDGSYPTGDVGIEALTPAFTLMGWEGGDPAGPVQPPTIASFTPASGQVGTSVAISGTNFTGATAVTFNGVSATFTVSSATAIQATVPAGATTGPVSVTTPQGTATSSGTFTVIQPPTIAGFAPASGPVGTAVTINGANFSLATGVAFNGASASFTVVSDATIQAVVPAGATTGPVSVTTAGGTATSTSNFVVTVTLTVAKAGNGAGSVASSPAGTSFAVGTLVTLTATPAVGSNFTSWAGCDTVSGTTCTVTMNASRSVTATFTLQTFPLSVTKSNLLVGDGTVTSTSSPSSASQINCGSTCSVLFNYGTVVTLTASPALLSTFNGWTGCDSVSGNQCTVTVRAARSVNASFLP